MDINEVTPPQVLLLSIFKELSAKQILELTQRSKTCCIKKGEILVQQGDVGASMFIVISGCLSVFIENGSKKKLVGRIEKNEIVGELALLTHDPRSATVIAEEDTHLLEISQDLLHSVINEDPATHQKLWLYSLKRLQQNFVGWLVGSTESRAPSRIRQILIVQLVAYPITSLQVTFLYSSLFAFLPLQMALFLSVIINVTLTSCLLLPWAFRHLSWWILPKKTSKLMIARDFSIMCMFFAIQMLFFFYLQTHAHFWHP